MSWWRQLRRGWHVLMRRAAADRELRAELQHYYDEEVTRLLSEGASPAEARRRARLQLGELDNVVEEVRAHGWERTLDAVRIDVRQGARRLWHSPGFTLASVLTLAIGLGASTAIFSAVKPILFDALPYDDAGRIVMVWDRYRDGTPLDITFGTHRELAQRSRSFAALAPWRLWQPTLTGVDQPERLEGQRVGAEYFRALGVRPALGRDFTDTEDQAGGANVVLLGHGLWQRRFNGDRTVIGRAITLGDVPFTVVGVLPADFENVLTPAAEIWAPLQYDAALPADGREWGHHLRLIGRLTPTVKLDDARRELNQIAQTPLPQFPRMPWASLNDGLLVNPLQDELARDVKPALFATMGAVLLLLAIACVNLAGLLLARGGQRSGELALRAALGAGRNRLLTQLVIETVLLALLGGMAALGVAHFGVRGLIALSPPELPRVNAMRLDAGVFGFALISALLIGLAVGVFAALHAARRAPNATLHRRSTRVTGGAQRTRRALVVAQVALAVVLLVSGGLLLRSLQRLFAIDPGFDAEQLLTMQVQTVSRRYDDDGNTQRFFAQVLDAVVAVPGVRSAAFTSQLPLSGDFQKYGVHLESAPALRPEDDGSSFRYAVTPGYFATMGIPLRQGRLLDERDHAAAPGAIVINESFARRRFQGVDPLGQRIRLGSVEQPWSTIVGIVGDVHQVSLDLAQDNAAYLPTTQSYFTDRALWLVVRADGDPTTLTSALKQAVWSVDRDQPITRVSTMADLVSRSAAERRFTLIIFEALAIAALLLAAVGLYGVLAAMVNARVREIGVRTALGATRAGIIRLVVGQGVTLTLIGLAFGLSGAVAAARAIRSLLFGVTALDHVTYAGVLLLMLAVCALACWLPARRAARVEPAITLRTE